MVSPELNEGLNHARTTKSCTVLLPADTRACLEMPGSLLLPVRAVVMQKPGIHIQRDAEPVARISLTGRSGVVLNTAVTNVCGQPV